VEKKGIAREKLSDMCATQGGEKERGCFAGPAQAKPTTFQRKVALNFTAARIIGRDRSRESSQMEKEG